MSEFDTGAGGDHGAHRGAPPNFWTILGTVASSALAALSLLLAATKTGRDETDRVRAEAKALEQRLCRLEARAGTGDCKL